MMRINKAILTAALFTASAFGQSAASVAAPAATVATPASVNGPQQFVGVGIYYNQYSTPNLSGYGAYAKQVSGGTYSYSAVDVTSVKVRPFTAQTAVETGIAQYITTVGKFQIYGLAAVGVSTAGNGSGTNVGAAFSGGGLATIGIKNGWSLQVPVRVLKTTLSGTQYVVGLGFGWGK